MELIVTPKYSISTIGFESIGFNCSCMCNQYFCDYD